MRIHGHRPQTRQRNQKDWQTSDSSGSPHSLIFDIVSAPASVRRYKRDLAGLGMRPPGPPNFYIQPHQFAFGQSTLHRNTLLKNNLQQSPLAEPSTKQP